MRRQRSISVVIPTRNQALLLKTCLSSFVNQTSYPKEIIVIDNNSSDTTKDVVLSYANRIPLLYLFEKRLGPAFARNHGIGKAKGEIIASIDGDCVLDRNWVENIWQAHKKHANSIIQGGWENFLTKDNVSSNLYFFFIETYRNILLTPGYQGRGKTVSFIDTKNFSLPRKVLLRNKLKFDENFRWDEHIDFGLQALDMKIPIIYDPSIKATHLTEKDFRSLIKLKKQIGEARAALEKKWNLKRKKEKYLNKSNEIIWQKRRKELVGKIERKNIRKIILNKSILYSLSFIFGVKILKMIQILFYRLNRALKYK